jgi:hypothetical protein
MADGSSRRVASRRCSFILKRLTAWWPKRRHEFSGSLITVGGIAGEGL